MRTHNTPRLCAGPQTAGTPIKFWNVASIGDDEGEITLYGDVVSRQPVDWWTGEPEPGLYIAPESFMEDLAAVKGKSNITIKINSCGGDLYTGIAIHNAIKGLTGHKVVVVEGIAASAASVIACAGDEVQVYPGSMVMIHGVAGLLYDYYTLADLFLSTPSARRATWRSLLSAARAKRNGPKKIFPGCAFFGLASTAGQRGASQYLRHVGARVEASARRCAALCACLVLFGGLGAGRLGGTPCAPLWAISRGLCRGCAGVAWLSRLGVASGSSHWCARWLSWTAPRWW